MDINRSLTIVNVVVKEFGDESNNYGKDFFEDSYKTYTALENMLCYNDFPMTIKGLRRILYYSGFSNEFFEKKLDGNNMPYSLVCEIIESFGIKGRDEFNSLTDALHYNAKLVNEIYFLGEERS